ncbi:TadE/TadG family type IV pilus assembly protein [Thalassoroseus pseudoceratinae]|uniref:TadE/TadG family type IV pilus assembly protein n=1 Tax=Thalassoroseus pseudoceratinae TaxID=2713176 RepID=UPI0014224B53|nr:TadE/TadG family type IV pilus assembly protein [Thalassoroseus pseudoceratinae]
MRRSVDRMEVSKFRSQSSKRSGVVTLEFILALPVLLIATLGIFEFGFLVLVNQAVSSAAVEGTREAAKIGTTPDEVAETVQEFLAVHNLTFQTDGTNTTDPVRVTIEGTLVNSDPHAGERGNTSITYTPNGPNVDADEVRVTVCVEVTDTNGMSPVPDLLATFGFSLQGRIFEASSRTEIE